MLKQGKILFTTLLTLFLIVTIAFPTMAAPYHTVAWGESLWQLANIYGTTVFALQEANGLWDSQIYAGEQLVIPEEYPAVEAARTVTTTSTRSPETGWEIDLLARMIHAEAESEPYAGKVAVGAVILNRLEDPRFPDDLNGVLFSPWEFEPVMNNRFWSITPSAEAYAAAEEALAGWDPTGGALYFYNPVTSTSPWIFSRPVVTQIGNHVFAL
ncbi:MAG: cell wall hydrolase [bacterium]|jgi:N-acetylmuramoyl-L-alanine amidase